MRVFAISDTHLSLYRDKPMDIFGKNWENHWGKISDAWKSLVTDNDIVLIAGDISWAMKYEEALPDLHAIFALPGHKVMIKGNHDYWHTSIGKTRALFPENAHFLQYDNLTVGEYSFVGTRGWKQRTDSDFKADDEKIYDREVARLQMSVKNVSGRIIGMSHFPPYDVFFSPSPFTDIYKLAGAEAVVYGHLHHGYDDYYDDVSIDGVPYILTSCDHLNFIPKLIAE